MDEAATLLLLSFAVVQPKAAGMQLRRVRVERGDGVPDFALNWAS
jgi:hypothetical protein